MKLIEFYKTLYEVAAPEGDPKDDEVKPEAPVLPDEPIVDPEKEVPVEDPKKDIGELKAQLKSGFEKFGCNYLFTVKKKKEKKLSELRASKTNPKWQIQLIEHIDYIKSQIIERDCTEEKEEKKDKTTSPVKTQGTPVIYTEPTKTTTTPTKPTTVAKSYETPKVLPEPIYNSENEITDISKIQSDELIDNAIIDLDNQISLQDPEIQEKLAEFNITSERMAYVLPLTRETRDFMMNMQMQGINLPHLMLMYNNIKTLYPAIEQGNDIDKNKILPLNKMINYNEFWEWSEQLWNNSNRWLKSNFIGTYPELDRSTLLP